MEKEYQIVLAGIKGIEEACTAPLFIRKMLESNNVPIIYGKAATDPLRLLAIKTTFKFLYHKEIISEPFLDIPHAVQFRYA